MRVLCLEGDGIHHQTEGGESRPHIDFGRGAVMVNNQKRTKLFPSWGDEQAWKNTKKRKL